ncbi:MAG: hypothetical protein KGI58_00380 [Patescibacteria group bacterium]|nr:hypothetical protein [Patescibacteria group bacterium]
MLHKNKTNGGEMDFLLMIIGVLVILFLIWAFTGGPNSERSQKPFIVPGNDQNAPLQTYGPTN